MLHWYIILQALLRLLQVNGETTSHIVDEYEYNCLLSDTQFNFLKGRYTEVPLLLTYERISDLVVAESLVDFVLLDLSKAFDVVCHSILLRQQAATGTSYRLVWLEAFLTRRTMRISCGVTPSSPRKFLSGVPQRSVLGPLLFLIYTYICEL